MKKQITLGLLLFLLNGIIGSANAQVVGGYFDKLAELYEQGQYEDCAFKSDRMTLRGKYSSDPEVYLYLAMSYHQIYLDTVLNKYPEYEKAYELALKNLVKAKRYDKVGEYFPNNDFAIHDIVKSGIPIMLAYTWDGKHSKAASMMRSFARLKEDQSLYFYSGAVGFFNYDKKLGNEVVDSILPNFPQVVKKARPEMKPVLADGIRLYFDYLMEDYYIDSAENLIEIATDFFPEDTALLRRSFMPFDSLRYE
ncbi:MAG: hypothetical protein PF448_01985 [Bacteroidales bacterium]|jgi:hypothetical protein|nr:hypothetical protein [Bacteroidales bacterium]